MCLEELAGAVVADGDRGGDAGVEARDRLASRASRSRRSCSAAVSPTRSGPSRCRFGVPSRKRIRSISFSACFISSMDSSRVSLGEVVVAPVLLHLGVDEVLVDRRQLAGQDLVEQLDDLGVPLHGRLLVLGAVETADDQALIRRPAARPRPSDASSASIVGRHPPHRAPAPQRAATRSASSAPLTISATICRSFTASHWHTSTGTVCQVPSPLCQGTRTSAVMGPTIGRRRPSRQVRDGSRRMPPPAGR